MIFPEAKDLKTLLEALLGVSLDVSSASDTPDLGSSGSTYASLLIDDSDNVIAAVAADLHAATRLGGALSMKPLGALEDELSKGQLDQVVLEALSEVFNNVTTTINRIDGNPHVRSKPAANYADLTKKVPWLASTTKRQDFSGDYIQGSGRLVLLAAP